MSEITKAIAAKQTQIKQLQSDIQTLLRAASIVGGRAATSAKPTPAAQPTTTLAQPKTKRRRRPWSAARREAMSKRMKERWATKRAAKPGRKK